MKKKTTFRDWGSLLAFGAVGMLAYNLIVVTVALLIGFQVAAFPGIPGYVAILISYLGIRFLLEGIEVFSGLRNTRCTGCKGRIKSSKPIKCEECGGAAQLVGKNCEANRSQK